MKRSEFKKLIEVRDKVQEMEGVKCRLTHERVRFDKESKLPIPHGITENKYYRLDLCPIEIRKKRLACGHTSARNFLREVLYSLSLYSEFDQNEISGLMENLDRLDIKINNLDHEKGHAELRYAEKLDLVYKENKEQKSAETIIENDLENEKSDIKKIEEQHDIYVDDMIDIRNNILKVMNETIDKRSNVIKNLFSRFF